MKLIPAPEYSIRVITPPTPELTPQSEITVAGVPTGKIIAGAILRVALRWGRFVLLFLTDDVPFEDALRMYLLDQDLAVVDSARMGAMYSTGIFSDLDLTEPDTVRFQFFEGVVWTLRLLSEEEFAIPVFSEPTGISRPFKFFRKIRLTAQPLPKTPDEKGEDLNGSTKVRSSSATQGDV
jgi:hypothetical protein